MLTISAKDTRPVATIVERCKARVDPAAVERIEKDRVARATADRIAFLYSRLFENVVLGRDVGRLRTENAAREMFRLAVDNANNRLQVEILRVAIDNRWTSVVNAFVKHWDDEHPISKTVEELWALTTGRSAI